MEERTFVIEHNNKSTQRWWGGKGKGWVEKDKAAEFKENDLPKDLNGIYFLKSTDEEDVVKYHYESPHGVIARVHEV